MDIYAYAESINYCADYLDIHTRYIYHIKGYGNSLRFGFPTDGIRVSDNNNKTIPLQKIMNES